MSREVRCWVCGRSVDEITAVLGGESEEELRFKQEIANTAKVKANLAENLGAWKRELPDHFKDFDLAFILQNADQFKSIRFVDQLVELGRSAIRDLDDASYRARRGEQPNVGSAPALGNHDLVIKRLDEFERRTNRRLKREEDARNMEYQRLGYIASLKGLKLAEGIDYLGQVALFYWDLQTELLELAQKAASKQRPIWSIRPIKFSGYTTEVNVCSVCERLTRELSRPIEANVRT